MVTVIIPALNEEKTIRQVIKQAKRNPLVDEIIVVDDMSTDNTIAEAKKEDNVRVITSTHVGKGDSMREGLLMAKNEVEASSEPPTTRPTEARCLSRRSPRTRTAAYQSQVVR